MTVIGCDPGLQGAIAAIQGPFDRLLTWPMPDTAEGILHVLRTATSSTMGVWEGTHVFVEKAQSMPKQGISSAFNYGCHFGQILGILTALKIPHTLVPPRTWAKVMHAGAKAGTPKERSREVAYRLFPGHSWLATERSRKDSDGLIDAALVAAYGARVLRPEASAEPASSNSTSCSTSLQPRARP